MKMIMKMMMMMMKEKLMNLVKSVKSVNDECR